MNLNTAIKSYDPESPLDAGLSNNSEIESVSAPAEVSTMPGSVHQSIAALLMEGKTPQQIGDLLSINAEKVRAILLLPHTQEYLEELSKKQGEKAVDALLKATEFDTVMTLIDVRDTSLDRKEQLAACKQLWTMRRGNRPTKVLEDGEEDVGGDVGERVKHLDKQIKAYLEQQSQGKNKNE